MLVLLLREPPPYPGDHGQTDIPQKGNASGVGGACSGYALTASPHTGFSSRLTRVLIVIVARQSFLLCPRSDISNLHRHVICVPRSLITTAKIAVNPTRSIAATLW